MQPSVRNLSWFSSKAERAIFKELGFASVYAAGPITSRLLKIGWTRFPQRITEHHIHCIVWAAGDLLAQRVANETASLLASRRLDSGKYDVPPDLAEQAINLSAEKQRVPTFSHVDMLARVNAFRQYRLDKAVRELERSAPRPGT
jgi:hypothetical protein